MTVTGRIDGTPARVWHDEVLAPQFDYEARHLLCHYVAIEKVLLLEYRRMGLVGAAEAAAIARRLDTANRESIRADPAENMSDISFALERYVALGPVPPFPAWHVDRSRNDFQACAQLMAAREELIALAGQLLDFTRLTTELAGRYVDTPMPGYTHAQAAQVITPGFYLSALSAETLSTVERFSAVYDSINASPLGTGTMAGQELDWDRGRMAALLGFNRPAPHALVAVASRGWALELSFGLASFAVTLSRFITDLMTWGGSEFGFIDLPDELAGISAAMPQKRNFPVLERIRGRCSHVAAGAFEVAQGQRNTPFTNTVEVSKEAGGHLVTQFSALRSTMRLTAAVISGLSFRADRMRAACQSDYLGGFTLANRLTLDAGIPWRAAQVIAGRYVKQAIQRGLEPGHPDPGLLEAVAREDGFTVPEAAASLVAAFDVGRGLRVKRSAGSVHPDAVNALLLRQVERTAEERERWQQRARALAQGAEEVSAQFMAHQVRL